MASLFGLQKGADQCCSFVSLSCVRIATHSAAGAMGKSKGDPSEKGTPKDKKDKRKEPAETPEEAEARKLKEEQAAEEARRPEGPVCRCADPILEFILSLLDHTHLFRSQRVCQRWRSVALSSISKLDHLSFEYAFPTGFDDDILKQLLAKRYTAASVQRVGLRSIPQLTDRGIKIMVEAAPQITFVDIRHALGISDRGFRALAALSLRALTLTHVPITEKGFRGFMDRVGASLVSLNLSHSPALDLDDFAEIIGARAPQLTALCISRCSGLSERAIAGLATLPNLVHLEMAWLKRVSPKGIAQFASPTSPAPLRSLDLTGNSVRDDAVALIVKSFPKLKSINLSFCSDLTATGLESLKSLKRLEVAHLEFTRLNSSSLRALDSNKKLQQIFVAGTEDLSDRALDKFSLESGIAISRSMFKPPE